jgi:hypothetical protein
MLDPFDTSRILLAMDWRARISTVPNIYNYSEHLPERRRMMQAWSDYLDTLKRRPVAGVREAA